MVLGSNECSDSSRKGAPERVVPDPLGRRAEGLTYIDATVDHGQTPERLTAVVFNGCIYNHRALRAELESFGHRFKTDHSDTEVLLHGVRAWGPKCFERCEGMLAAAVWDRGRLMLARDAFGEKPLYWFCQEGIVGFASTAAALVQVMVNLPSGLSVHPEGMVGWIADGYRLGNMGLLDIEEVLPGQVLVFDGKAGGCRPQILNPVAAMPEERSHGGINRETLLTEVESAIEQAVAMRLEADVPLACFLSGGVDSSVVAMMARRLTQRLQTVCVRMPSDEYDESPHARKIAKIIGSDHTEIEVHPAPVDDLVRLIGQLGLPFGDSSILPTHWASGAIDGGVALGGDGGDELFLGYERQSAAKYLRQPWSMLAKTLGPIALKMLSRSNPRSTSDKLARLIAASKFGSYRELGAITQRDDIQALLKRGIATEVEAPCAGLNDAQRYDLNVYLPGDLMRKSDTASMAHPIEVRSPFLDRTLARLIGNVPLNMLCGKSGRKGLLRDVARRHLPAEVIDRPKQGFAIPLGAWFRSDFGGLRRCLYDHLDRAEPFEGLDEGLIDRACVARWLREHDAAQSQGRGRDHSQRLFVLLSLSVWCAHIAQLRRT